MFPSFSPFLRLLPIWSLSTHPFHPILTSNRSANELPLHSIGLRNFPSDPARFRRSSHSCTRCVRRRLRSLGLDLFLHSNRRRIDSSVCSGGNSAYRHRFGFLSTLPPSKQRKADARAVAHHNHHRASLVALRQRRALLGRNPRPLGHCLAPRCYGLALMVILDW